MNDNKIKLLELGAASGVARRGALHGPEHRPSVRATAQFDLTQDRRYTIPPALGAHRRDEDRQGRDASRSRSTSRRASRDTSSTSRGPSGRASRKSAARPGASSSTSSSIRRTTSISSGARRRSSRSRRSRCRTCARAR